MKRTLRLLGVRACTAKLLAALALLLSFLAAGCVELSLPDPSAAPVEAPREQTSEDLSREAEGFWTAGNHPQSELLHSRLLERELTREARLQALDRLAASAFQSRHFYQAKSALDRRAAADGSALTTWPWHELYIKTLNALNRPDLVENHRAWLAAHTELPFEVRSRAAMSFAELYARNGEMLRAVDVLAHTHSQAPDRKAKAAMEAEYAGLLRDLPEAQLQGLASIVGRNNAKTFPHALVQHEMKRRALSPRAEIPAAAPVLSELAALPVLLAQATGRTRSDQPAALIPAGVGGPVRVALVLPLTGRFASTAAKVLGGAALAQASLAAQGRSVELKAINTESPDWREQIKALPPGFSVVGGPMQPDRFQEMQASGVMAARAVFAFLPVLKTVQEGAQAWRFFPSPRDQVRALVNLAADQLGIRSVAVLAPKNPFGQGMAEVFLAEAKAKGLRLAASETYPPDDHPRWGHSVGRLLKIPEGFRRNKNVPLPMPDFGAVFVPVDWDKAELLVSNFHFFEGQHLVFLGTELWSVALDSAKDIDDTYFQLAACPGAWWPEAPAARALQARLAGQSTGQAEEAADFWVALGHDFIQFAARLNLPVDWTPTVVNQRLAAVRGMEFSMAPITWDAEGRARQDLYLFSPRKEGKALLDPEALRVAAAKARERREKRLAYSRELQKAKKLDGPSGSLTRESKD
ncbi:MAG: hypothetical protein C0405_04385 [Desulfovibrio sp.]|nr:hypothetical protein [Desulfovibrio sp.]